jgi:hypothetical protein
MMRCEIYRGRFEFFYALLTLFVVPDETKPCSTQASKLSCFKRVRRFCGMSAEPAGKQFLLWCLIRYRIGTPF